MKDAIMTASNIDFLPPLWMRPAMVQTGLASLKFRGRGQSALELNSHEEILTTAASVRLKIVTTDHQDEGHNEQNRPVIIFIHGWEGSSDSTYVVAASRRVYAQGCSVVRLNLRDHGETHGLNEGAFFATLFDEVFDAVSIICQRYKNRPVLLVGFSLGGNYVLRTACQLVKTPIDNLARLIAISPVIDPPSSNPSLDDSQLIKAYFLKKWRRSMRLKQAAFPQLYNFDDVIGMDNIMEMTEILIARYTDYPNAMAYFAAYAVGANDVKDCPAPLTIIAAQDDPVVPMEMCKSLMLSPQSQLLMWPHGGHNGFFQSLSGPTGYDDVIADIIRML